MTALSGSVGRDGVNKPSDVQAVQLLLNRHINRLGLPRLVPDRLVGPKTINAIEAFQHLVVGLTHPDGRVDPNGRTHRALDGQAATTASTVGRGATSGGSTAAGRGSTSGSSTAGRGGTTSGSSGTAGRGSTSGSSGTSGRGSSTSTTSTTSTVGAATVAGAVRSTSWPPKPAFRPLTTNDQRARVFGRFQYVAAPVPGNRENIRILGDWVQRNITSVRVDMGPRVGTRNIQVHRLVAGQMQSLWQAWGRAGLLDRVLTFDGAFVPRFKRRSTTSLSNHSFGSAFDINAATNGFGATPALLGERGCVRELVAIANANGFYWGGHFSYLDGMHFEVARVM
jgi:hypothetical protein